MALLVWALVLIVAGVLYRYNYILFKNTFMLRICALFVFLNSYLGSLSTLTARASSIRSRTSGGTSNGGSASK